MWLYLGRYPGCINPDSTFVFDAFFFEKKTHVHVFMFMFSGVRFKRSTSGEEFRMASGERASCINYTQRHSRLQSRPKPIWKRRPWKFVLIIHGEAVAYISQSRSCRSYAAWKLMQGICKVFNECRPRYPLTRQNVASSDWRHASNCPNGMNEMG